MLNRPVPPLVGAAPNASADRQAELAMDFGEVAGATAARGGRRRGRAATGVCVVNSFTAPPPPPCATSGSGLRAISSRRQIGTRNAAALVHVPPPPARVTAAQRAHAADARGPSPADAHRVVAAVQAVRDVAVGFGEFWTTLVSSRDDADAGARRPRDDRRPAIHRTVHPDCPRRSRTGSTGRSRGSWSLASAAARRRFVDDLGEIALAVLTRPMPTKFRRSSLAALQ